MRFTNFTNGCMSKIMSFILCVLLGIILALGGEALAGYILLTREGMVGELETRAKDSGIELEFAEAYRSMSLLEWGGELAGVLKEINNAKIGDIESLIGLSVISKALEDAVGVEASAIKASTLSELGKTISNNLTVILAQDKFGIGFPDFPVFKDDTFLTQPLSTAFESLSSRALKDFLTIDENSSAMLKAIKDVKIDEVNDKQNGVESKINELALKDVITITTEGANPSHPVIISLADVKIGDIGKQAGKDKIDRMQLKELMTIKTPAEGGSKALYALRNACLQSRTAKYGVGDPIIDGNGDPVTDAESNPLYYEAGSVAFIGDGQGGTYTAAEGDIVYNDDGSEVKILGINDMLTVLPLSALVNTGTSYVWNYLSGFSLNQIGAAIDNMCVHHAVNITAASHPVLRKMREYNPAIDDAADAGKFGTSNIKISELGTALPGIIKTLTVGEIIDIDENDPSTEPILIAIKDAKMDELNTRIGNLKVSEVFRKDVYSTGALALIDAENTNLTDLSTEINKKMQNVKLEKLKKLGLTNNSMESSNYEVRAVVRNSTLFGMIDSYISALQGTPAVPQRLYLTDNNDITPDYIDALGAAFTDGLTLVLFGDTTVSGEFTRNFNIMTNGFNLTIADGTTFTSREGTPEAEAGGYMFISNASHAANILLGYDAVSDGGSVYCSYTDDSGVSYTDEEITALNADVLSKYFVPADIANADKLTIELVF